MPRKSSAGVLYAAGPQEADELMLGRAAGIDLDRAWLPDGRWAAVLDLACDPSQGIGAAERALLGDREELRGAERRRQRECAIAVDWAIVEQEAGQMDAAVLRVAAQCREVYLAARPVNFTATARPITESAFEALRRSWRALGAQADFLGLRTLHSFRSFPVRESAAADGDAHAGGPLGRDARGSLFVTVRGVTLHAHVDVVRG